MSAPKVGDRVIAVVTGTIHQVDGSVVSIYFGDDHLGWELYGSTASKDLDVYPFNEVELELAIRFPRSGLVVQVRTEEERADYEVLKARGGAVTPLRRLVTPWTEVTPGE